MSGLSKIKTGGIAAGCALPSDATATTQSQGDNSTKLATTAYVDTATSGIASDSISEGNTTVECVDTGSDGHITFDTDGTERGRFDNNGRLMLGSVTGFAGPRLLVQHNTANDSSQGGVLALAQNSSTAVLTANSTLGSIRFTDKDGDEYSRILSELDAGASTVAGRLEFHTTPNGGSLTERMRITSDGNVGIGETSPTATLHIAGGTARPALFLHGSNKDIGYNSILQFGEWDGSTYTERMRIDSSGTLKVGGSGQLALDISYSGSGSTAGKIVTNTGITNTASTLTFAVNENSGAQLQLVGDGSAIFSEGSTERMRIGGDGIVTVAEGMSVDGMHLGHGNASSNASNVCFGESAGSAITTGIRNVCIGHLAGRNVTTPNYAVLIGHEAGGVGVMTGEYNIGIGVEALEDCTSGQDNTCVGREAGQNLTTGSNNTLIGSLSAYYDNITGDGNTAVGRATLSSLTSGSQNIAIGQGALGNLDTGSNNVAVGVNAGYTNSPAGSIVSSSDILVLGDNDTANFYCADTSISSSDQRDKADITDFTHGLDWITQMRPVTYKWDKRSWYNDWDANPDVDLLTLTPDGTHKKDKVNIGLLAQEVRTIEAADGYATTRDTQLLAYDNEDGKSMGLKYERIVPVLINAIKELKTANDALTARVAALEAG